MLIAINSYAHQPVLNEENPISFGGEITFDINLFRQSAIFDLGLRWSYITNTLNGENDLVFELMLGSIGL